MNALALTPEALFAVCCYSKVPLAPGVPDDYDEMGYFSANGAPVVTSSGWLRGEWSPLRNGDFLKIVRGTRVATVTAVLESASQ